MKYLLPLLLFGCAATETAEDVEWRHGIDKENWQMCEAIYKEARVYTLHIGHIHRRGIEPRWYEIRDDLYSNDCRRALGDYWIEY